MAKSAKKNILLTEIGVASIGMAIGGVLGLLLSPRSGKQNRALVGSKAKKVAHSIEAATEKQVKKAKKKVGSKK